MKVIIVLTFLFSFNLHAAKVNVKDRFATYQYYRDVYPVIFGSKDFAHKKTFTENFKSLDKNTKKKALSFIKEADHLMPDKILRPIVYWRYIKPNKKNLRTTLSFFMLYRMLIIRDFINDPLVKEQMLELTKARNLLKEVFSTEYAHNAKLFGDNIGRFNLIAKEISNLTNEKAFIKGITQTKELAQNLYEKVPGLPKYVLSYIGLVPGNKVKLLSYNDTSIKRMKWYNDRVIFNGGKLDFDAPHIQMPNKDSQGHVAFATDEIFMQIKKMIDEAEHSIFIDIFLFGGTFGATLTEYLIDQTLKKGPNFKTMILHDYATNYNMLDEMMPIFEYINKRREQDPNVKKKVMLLQANIQRHPPGIPFNLTSLLPKTPEMFAIIEKKNTYYESKIDHSKVIVIDANTDNAQAYFGSKNWSDHSGGYYYDDAIWVKGPLAALVQATYLHDVKAALTEDPKELAWFYYKEKGFDNKAYLKNKKQILNWMKVKQELYTIQGSETLRLAQADVDGTVKNARNVLIDMISKATKSIYMEQLFIYDPYVVDALIKRKIIVPNLDIKILADHNGNFGMNGFPNTMFIKELKQHKIQIRARKTYGEEAVFPNGKRKTYHQENHRKITSVDGVVLMGGSSNLNPDTLQGSFREFGAQIYSVEDIQKFNERFLAAWNDPKEVMELDIENFQIKIGDKHLSKEMSAIINGFGQTLMRSKDVIEKRY